MVKHDFDLLYDTVSFGGIKDLSPLSAALCVMSLGAVNKRYLWASFGLPLSDDDWNTLDRDISLALDEIMSGLVGLVVPAIFATGSIFKFLPCDGSVYNKDDYTLLYDSLDTNYIISGTQFVTPDLRNRSVVGAGGNYDVGDTGGVDEHVLTVGEMPAHTHGLTQYTFGIDIESVGVPDPTGVGQPRLPEQTDSRGGGNSHENRSPFHAIKWFVIAS